MSDAPTLPPSLDLPPHLSAHKYFFVCTLTVAAWDTLVLSPRSWRLLRTKEWPALKLAYHFLRLFMPVEFTIVGVAFFDTKWSQDVSDSIAVFIRARKARRGASGFRTTSWGADSITPLVIGRGRGVFLVASLVAANSGAA